MLGGLLGPLERALFDSGRMPNGVVFGLAMVPPVAAGLWLYRGQAAIMLGIALGVGVGLYVLARVLRIPTGVGTVLPALIGVGLVGPGAVAQWALVVAVGAGLLELCRASLIPAARIEAGLVAYCGVFLAERGSLDRYLNPGTAHAAAEPVTFWLNFFGASSNPIEPIRLYVGNVPGPVFATSLLAVVIGAAWLWYARRLSLAVVAGFALGVIGPAWLLGWNLAFQLMSGPMWLVVAFILADRVWLPESRATRPLLGIAGGVTTMALRVKGIGIEGAFLAVAGLQVVVALVEGAGWLFTNRGALWRSIRSGEGRRAGQGPLAVAHRRTA